MEQLGALQPVFGAGAVAVVSPPVVIPVPIEDRSQVRLGHAEFNADLSDEFGSVRLDQIRGRS